MHFTVYCLDHPGTLQQRLEQYDAHKAYLQHADIRPADEPGRQHDDRKFLSVRDRPDRRAAALCR